MNIKLKPKTMGVMFDIARAMASLSKCPEGKQHGCVLAVEGRYIISTGYNGPAVKHKHCTECIYSPKTTDCPAVHAEENALLNAARLGIKVEGAYAYVTKEPCPKCKAILKNAGVKVVGRWT